jgi:hypothetical protein
VNDVIYINEVIAMEDKMEYFIDQIGQIYNATYGNGMDKHQYSYFIYGGCYVLTKVVKHYKKYSYK